VLGGSSSCFIEGCKGRSSTGGVGGGIFPLVSWRSLSLAGGEPDLFPWCPGALGLEQEEKAV
jgi:hypothetical protein